MEPDANAAVPGPSAPGSHIPYGAPFSYNIPPTNDAKEQNVNFDPDLPPYNAVSPDDNLQVCHYLLFTLV